MASSTSSPARNVFQTLPYRLDCLSFSLLAALGAALRLERLASPPLKVMVAAAPPVSPPPKSPVPIYHNAGWGSQAANYACCDRSTGGAVQVRSQSLELRFLG